MVKIKVPKPSTKLLVVLFISIIVIVSVIGWTLFLQDRDNPEGEKTQIIIENHDEQNITVMAELATTPEERSKGLMYRESLCEDCGMLFVYGDNVTGGFWMKNTKIPLSIAFIAENGTILDIQQMEPETLDIHKPGVPYRYALEVNQGFYEDNSIQEGDRVNIPEDIDAE